MELNEKLIPFFTTQERESLVPQQINLLNNAVSRVIKNEGVAALTKPRLEGIKEMVLEHLWPDSLSTVEKVRTSMEGFECLSSHWNFYTTLVSQPVMDQVLNGVEGWTSLTKTFPIVIGVRAKNRLFLLFRRPEEDPASTEATALAMVAAYDADEIFLCSATDVLGGIKAFLVSRTKTTEGVGIFFQLTEGEDRWVIGDPVGKIDPNTLSDFMGSAAFQNLNTDSASSRGEEARQALTRWQPTYDWRFEAVRTSEGS
jgi:hypothetical protein